jgi:hypothetical protein
LQNIYRKIKTDSGSVDILVVSCLHIGSDSHNEERALRIRDYILNTPNTYVMELGDTTENALKGSPGAAIYRQKLTIKDQIDAAIEFWKPVTKENKLILKHDSNHGFRTEKEVGFSLDQILSEKLGVPYGGWDALTTIEVNKQKYVIHSCHGKKGGATPEAALKACRMQSERAIADIYVRGHHHKAITYTDIIKDKDAKGNIYDKRRSYGVTGAFMNWDDSYAEVSEYPIAVQACLMITLLGTEKKHSISIF